MLEGHAKVPGNKEWQYLLRTLLIDDGCLVLGLVAVLPVEIYDQLAAGLLLAGVNDLNLVFPRARWWCPFLGRRWCSGGGMRGVLA